jgi:hypothetical protein
MMLGGGDRDFPPPCPDFVISDYRMLAPHWSRAATAHQKAESGRKCFVERASRHFARQEVYLASIV